MFRTILPPQKSVIEITHQSPILSIGSCFAQHIGQRLKANKFEIVLNPFGIIYNPFSIAKSIDLLLQDQHYQKNQLFEYKGLWHSFDHHSIFSQPDLSSCLNQINKTRTEGRNQLRKANFLIITLGTAFAFKHKKNNTIVANNHKLPADTFEKVCLSVEEITASLSDVIKKLQPLNTAIKTILTVSPVRHTKNGLIDNQRSKARLLLACEHLSNSFDEVYYFPAYELLLDDLRDYRFYDLDMIHPNETALNYIWDFFKATYFNPATSTLLQQIEKIRTATQHRPFHPKTEQHQNFIKNQLHNIQSLQQSYPFLDFGPSEKALKSS